MAVYREDIVEIELESGTVHRSFLNHSIGSGDNKANRFGIRALRNGRPTSIGGTCAGYFIRADGQTVVIANGTVEGNEAYVTLPEACYAVEGQFTLAIKCTGGGATGTMRIVDGVVSRTTTDAIVDPGTLIPSIEDLIEAIDEAVASIPEDYGELMERVDDLEEQEFPVQPVPSLSEYDSLISHITDSGRYQLQGEPGDWLDMPDGVTAGTLIVYRYGTNYVLQVLYPYLGNRKTAHYRIVHRTNYNVYLDWTDLALMWKKVLTSSDDLNSITTEGVYRWNASTSKPSHAPFDMDGFMLVLANMPGTNCVQICISTEITTGGGFAVRASQSNNGTWTSWIYPGLVSAPNALFSVKNAITLPFDLDTLTDVGMYWYSDSNIPDHAPDIPYGGVINVFGSTSANSQKIQLYTGYGTEAERVTPERQRMAYRVRSGSRWSQWWYLPINDTPEFRDFTRKRLSILGDSISTYDGYVPTGTGYASYYHGNNCGVSSVDETWWKRLLDNTGMILCKNNSVSGSCMSTAARQDRVSGCMAERTGGLSDGTNNPDIVIVYMGMNDFLNAVDIGDYDGNGAIPADMTVFRNAYATALLAIMNNYPNAKVYCCTTHHTEFNTTTQTPQLKIHGSTQAQFNEQIRDLARIFCAEVIDFEKCGITTGNIESKTGDNVSAGGTLGRGLHPNAAGHELLFREAFKHFS